jgi:hypothetical protein
MLVKAKELRQIGCYLQILLKAAQASFFTLMKKKQNKVNPG